MDRKRSRSSRFGIYVFLIVEDKSGEAEKAVKAVEGRKHIAGAAYPGFIGAVPNVEAAIDLMDLPGVTYDGVLTDMYLTKEPVGLEIVMECQKREIPCVVCTDCHSHPENNFWYKLAQHMGADLVTDKDWGRAVDLLIQKIDYEGGEKR